MALWLLHAVFHCQSACHPNPELPDHPAPISSCLHFLHDDIGGWSKQLFLYKGLSLHCSQCKFQVFWWSHVLKISILYKSIRQHIDGREWVLGIPVSMNNWSRWYRISGFWISPVVLFCSFLCVCVWCFWWCTLCFYFCMWACLISWRKAQAC